LSVPESSRQASETWSVKSVLAWASEDFRKRQNSTPRLDAELLLAEVLGLDRVGLVIQAHRPLAAAELAAYRELIKRRRGGEPIAYILGRREFYGLEFRVDRRVLIPRPDSETLVEVALARTSRRDMFGRALDLCTGSGCVAIAFAKARPTWEVSGSDVSREAVACARDNALRLGCPRIRWLEADLFASLARGERFDLVCANPPYVTSADLARLEPDIRDFEPALALDGGPDGLDLVRRIVGDARERLEPGGVLALEVGHDQAERVARELEAARFSDVERRRDLGGHERVVSGTAA
jgi:release factor glutamine methyltransferase